MIDGLLRQSTAVTVPIGPFVDSTDGDTEETGLTIAQADVRLKKAGGAGAQKNNATSATHDADAVYDCPLSTTDTNTLGQLVLYVHVAGAAFVRHVYAVVPPVVYDALIAGTDNLDISVVQWLGTACATPTVAGVPEVDATHWGGTAVASAAVRATLEQVLGTAITEGAAGRLAAALTAFLNVAAPVLTVASVNQTGDSFARIGANGASLSAIPDEAGVTTLLSRVGTPSNLGGGATVAANLSDIEAQTDDIGTAGAGLTAIPDSAGVTTLLSRIPSALFSGITSLAQWLGLIAGKQVGDATARTEIRATGAGSGTFDETTESLEAIRDRGDAAWVTGTTPPTAAAIASQVRTELATELARIDVAVSTRLSTAGYTVPLDAAGTRSALGMASANMDTQLAALDTLIDTAIANIAALNNISTSDVLTQVNSALNTAISELTGVPSATPTLRTALMFLYMALRNRTTTTATEQTVQNDAGTPIATAVLSDDSTTMTKAEFA
jgi:hypothetical protein